jgi:hypothetical protein
VNRNRITSTNNRLIASLGFIVTPFSWGNIRANFSSDGYTNENLILRHPESIYGVNNNGVLDVATDVTRNLNGQVLLNVNRRDITQHLSITGLLGTSVNDAQSQANGLNGLNFLDPNFVSINNTNQRVSRTTLVQRRLMSAFGSVTANYRDYLYVTVTGRNDWTSTIPVERNSFFYPAIQSSFVLSDAVPAIGEFMTARLRGSYAEVGKDARPYAFRPVARVQDHGGWRLRLRFHGPQPQPAPGVRELVRVRRRPRLLG